MSESTKTEVTLGGVKYEVTVQQAKPGSEVGVTIKEVKATMDYYVVEVISPTGSIVSTYYKRHCDGAATSFHAAKQTYPTHTVILWVVQIPERLTRRDDFSERKSAAARFMRDHIEQAEAAEEYQGRGAIGEERTIFNRIYKVTDSHKSSWNSDLWMTHLVPKDAAGNGEYIEIRTKIVDPRKVERKVPTFF